MTPKAGFGLALLLMVLAAHGVLAATPSTVVLSVEGMT
jgi:hypothetical protein